MPRKTVLLLAFVFVKFVLQYVLVDAQYDLHRDEYLHLDQGHYLAWGYVSVPPFTSWVSWIIFALGGGVFWVKFFPALFGALTLVVVWKAIETLKGDTFALCLGATCVLLSVLLRINLLYQPNSFDVLCWTSFYYFCLRYAQTESPRWSWLGAVVFALGFLNKYNMVFLLGGLLPALLLSPQRKWLARRQTYWAVGLALLLISPNIWWQYQNDFPVVHHMQELARTQLVNTSRVAFLKEQLLFFAGALPIIVAGLYALLVYKPFAGFRFFFAALVFTLAIFWICKAKGYYAIGIYPIYISFGAVFVSQALQTKRLRYVRLLVFMLPVATFLPMYQVAFPNHGPEYVVAHSSRYQDLGLLRWEDGKDHSLPQDFADMLGWRELARKTDSIYAPLAAQGRTMVLCDNYGQAGAINYYSKTGIRAVSFNADYVGWFDLSVPYINFIRIKEYDPNEDELEQTGPYFQTGQIAARVTNQYAREYRTAIFAFSGAKIDINPLLANEVREANSNR
ncbi:glycosyltransferase family 39 protein [Flavobacterium caeni]|uniref:Dolichyl-phosphate-mannose-protein mannosyltransferase n=1 Tax=Flavobacterium caeni TaxID=490189 RepID=A0A1G5JRK9_9FLAO|nr:glycosyltransferase family 39 protein [Flavobacterium caeni]SCY90531.1 Dolichyl-phosphate-mannose-protein mannosyltransferase [Flavobacterium caeni]